MKKKKYKNPEVEITQISPCLPITISKIDINNEDYTDDEEPYEAKEISITWGDLWTSNEK